LNTKKAEQTWGDVENALKNIGVLGEDGYTSMLSDLYIKILSGDIKYEDIYHQLREHPTQQQLFLDWVVFLSTVTDYVESKGFGGLDIHRYNFAYDAGGNLKAIDI